MIRRAVLGVVAIAAMVAPATASAGGFATVGLHQLPTGVRAGATWSAEFTILQHGRTPAAGLQPVVTIARVDGTDSRQFTATPSGSPGVYRVAVVFPSNGSWSMAISEWAGSPGHTFPVKIGGNGQPASAGSTTRTVLAAPDGNGPWGALLAALAAGLVAGTAASVLQRRREPGAA
jgi:hypothetical protein